MNFFEILGISSTNDLEEIKSAYRKKLVDVNPEDNPEEFKILREAYEEAINSITKGIKINDDKVTEWINKVKDVYNNLETRRDVESWRSLFDDEVCHDFDFTEEIKDAFITFLMDYYWLPKDVWEFIEETYDFNEMREELYEKYPENFVNYIVKEPSYKGWFKFNLLNGDPYADIDKYINLSDRLMTMNGSGNYEEVENILEELKSIDLHSEAIDTELMRYYLWKEDLDKALSLALELNSKNLEDDYIKYYIAEVFFKVGKYEEAFEMCKKLIENYPPHYSAHRIMASYYVKKEDFKNAKETFYKLLELYPNDNLVNEEMRKANELIIEKYEEDFKKNLISDDEKEELAWSYIQNDKFEEGLETVKSINFENVEPYTYYNLLGRTYCFLKDYKNAYPILNKWLEEILKINETAPKYEERIKRLSTVYALISDCHYDNYINNNKKEEDLKKTLEFIDKAIEVDKVQYWKIGSMLRKAYILTEIGEYKTCIDLCSQIIELDRNCYYAYFYRQKCSFHLDLNQDVIDDYYNLTDIYAMYPEPYLLAIEVYLKFDMYEDALNIILDSEANEVISNEIKFQKLVVERLKAKDKEESLAVIEKIDNFYKEIENDKGDLKDIEFLFYQKAIAYHHIEEYNKAYEIINNQLKDSDRLEVSQLKARVLTCLDKKEEGAILFNKCYEESKDDYWPIVDYEDMNKIFIRSGKINESIKLLEDTYKNVQEEDGKVKCLIGLAKTYALLKSQKTGISRFFSSFGDSKNLNKYIDILINEYGENVKALQFLGEYYAYYLKNFEKALEVLHKGIDLEKDKEDFYKDNIHGIINTLIEVLYILDFKKELKKYTDNIFLYIEKNHNSIEEYAKDPSSAKATYYSIAFWSLASGDLEKAKYYQNIMKKSVLCSFCTMCSCYEDLLIEAKIQESVGQYKEAYENYKKAFDIHLNDLELIYKIETLKDKI